MGMVPVGDVVQLLQLIPFVVLVWLLGYVIATILVYFKIQRLDRAMPRGAIFRHVWRVGLSYILFILCLAVDASFHINDGNFTWQLTAYFVAGVVGLWSMQSLLGFERTRYHALRSSDAPRGFIQHRLQAREEDS